MKQIIKDFKAILADKQERKEFIGGFTCVIAMMAVMYLLMVVFHIDGLLK